MRKKYALQYHRRIRRRRTAARLFALTALIFAAAVLNYLRNPFPIKKPLLLFPSQSSPSICVYLHRENTLRKMPLDSYLMLVLAAEMPASYHMQALRAQAVAARSYTCFRIRETGGSGCASHPEADICTDHTCCQAYSLEEKALDTRILSAVFDTCGEVLTYDGKIINALYHACSGGYTEDSEAVFSAALPYLRSVESPNEESYPQYSAQYEFSAEELKKIFDIDPNLPLAQQFKVRLSSSGRVESVAAGGREYRGSEFRRLLNLPSTRMTLSFSASKMTVCTSGYGHGVGMSQVGADAMAQRGADYREILEWYYTDCRITSAF